MNKHRQRPKLKGRKILTCVSLDPKERRALERIANAEGRSMSAQVRFMLRDRLDEVQAERG